MTPVTITENYILLISDEEIKEGEKDFYILVNDRDKIWINRIKKVIECKIDSNVDKVLILSSGYLYVDEGKKIIAHLPLNNSPILEGVPLLPPLPNEDDVEKLAIEEVGVDGEIYNLYDHETFIKGYNKAKEKYKYTEEDLRKAIDMAQSQYWDIDNRGFSSNTEGDWSFKHNEEEIIQSLSQPKLPTHFNVEMVHTYKNEDAIWNTGKHPLIINGVMQGEWIYNN